MTRIDRASVPTRVRGRIRRRVELALDGGGDSLGWLGVLADLPDHLPLAGEVRRVKRPVFWVEASLEVADELVHLVPRGSVSMTPGSTRPT